MLKNKKTGQKGNTLGSNRREIVYMVGYVAVECLNRVTGLH